MRIAGTHLIVDADSAALADRKPCRLGQRHVGAHSEREDHEVTRMCLAGFRSHIDGAVPSFLECGDSVAEREPDTMAFQACLHKASKFLIDRRQNLIGQFHKGDFNAEMDEIFGHFQTNKPAADNNRAHLPVCHVAFFNPFLDLAGVRHRPNLKDPGKVYPWQRRTDDTAPGDRTSLS